MRFHVNVTEQDLIFLAKSADQQKKRRATKIENRNLKQTFDENLAETCKPISKKLTEKNEFTAKIEEVFEKAFQLAVENTQLASQSPQKETEKIVSASDD